MTTILTKKKDTTGAPAPGDLTNAAGGAELAVNTFDKRLYTKDSGGNVVEIGTNPTILNIDNIEINGNTISSTNTNGNINLTPNGTGSVVVSKLQVTGTFQLDGNVTVGDSSADTLTVNSTITSNLIFTDNTYDIGASGATRPRTGYFGTSVISPLFVAGAGTVSAPAITTTGDLNTGIYFPAADTIAFTEGGVESMRIDSSGNVGIGSTNPYSLSSYRTVDIDGASGGLIALRQSGTVYSLIYANNGQTVIQSNTAIPMLFNVNGSERMRIDSSGNVGIGTTAPNARATIKASGNTYTNGALALVSSASNSSYLTNVNGNLYVSNDGSTDHLVLNSSGNLGLGVTPSAWNSVYKALQINNSASFYGRSNGIEAGFTTNAFRDNVVGWQYINTDAAARYDQISNIHAWYNTASGTAGTTIAWTQAMTLNGSGRLFIGTTTGVGNEFVSIQFDSSGSITQAINTLDANASSSNNYHFVMRKSDATYLGGLRRSGTDNAMAVDGNSYLALQTGGTERMRITSGGNVGIGVSNPGVPLDVHGSASTTFTNNPYTLNLVATNTYGANIGSGVHFTGKYNTAGNLAGFATISGVKENATDGNYAGALTFMTRENGSGAGNQERMRITSGGDLLLGTTSSTGGKFHMQGNYARLTDGTYTGIFGKGSDLIVGGGASDLGIRSDAAILFSYGSTERMRINAGAPILCLAGGNTSATGTGIAFPATQSASSDANTLDDYEEGSWTPRLADASSGGNSNTTNSNGWYTKIGNQVTVYGRIDPLITTGLTAANQVWIRDLPFTAANTMGVTTGPTVTSTITFTGTAPIVYLGNSATGFRWYAQASGGGAQLLVSSIVSGTSWIYFVITYQVS